MSFKEPLFLLLLILLPLLVYRFFYRKRLDSSFVFSKTNIFTKSHIRTGFIKSGIVFILYISSVFFVIIGLAGPRKGKQFEKRLSEGVDLMIALDVSGSMQSVDNRKALNASMRRGYYHDIGNILTNRLKYAKIFTADFIKKRKNDRLGLVVFAGYSYTKCPLTFDHPLLINLLEQVNFKDVNLQSTAIGLAIANGVSRLIKSKAKSRVLILITDGANNAGSIDPITAAEIAKTLKIKIYTIGFGSNQPLMPTKKSGYYVRSSTNIDEDTLKKISKMTGGRYFRARGGGKLSEIYDIIDKMEKTIIQKKVFVEYEEKYQIFLILSLLSIVLAQILRYLVFKMTP